MDTLGRKPQLPTFLVTQSEYDAATDKERNNMRVFEEVLIPPARFKPKTTK